MTPAEKVTCIVAVFLILVAGVLLYSGRRQALWHATAR